MILFFASVVWVLVLIGALLRSRNNYARDVLAMGLLGAGTLLFFWRLLAGQISIPAGGGDLAQFLYPTYAFAAEWWRRGVVPLWNPYLFGGAPFVGDSQSGLFYPLNLLTFFLSAPLAFRDLELLSVLHFALAGINAYALLRWGKWRAAARADGSDASPHLARVAALAGALAYEYSDLFITHFGNLNLIAVAAWLPLVLLLFRRAVTDRRVGLAVWCGVVLAVAFTAGHPQVFLFVVLVLVLWTAFETVRTRDAGPLWPVTPGAGWRATSLRVVSWVPAPILLLGFAGVVAIGLSAPSLLPNLEMTQYTLRATYPYESAAGFSIPPAELIGLLVPGFFGRGAQNTWAPWDRVEVGYAGVLPLLLAVIAIIVRRDTLARYWGAVTLIGMGLALGGYAILHGWLYQFVPGFGQLRSPSRFVVIYNLGLAALAAMGFDALVHSLERAATPAFKRVIRVLPWACFLIAVAAGALAYGILILGQGQDPVLYARIKNAVNALAFFVLVLGLAVGLIVARGTRFFDRRVWSGLALALIFFDLFSLGAYVDVSTDDPMRVYAHADAAAFIKDSGSMVRIDPRGTGVDSSWPADTAILYGLYSVDGDNPLVLADFDRYWQALPGRASVLYDLLNVRYLVGGKRIELDKKFQLAFDGDPAVNVYENTHAYPRAYVVPGKRWVTSASQALAAMNVPEFNPAATAIVVGQGQPVEVASSNVAPVGVMDQAAHITGYGPNEIQMQVNAGAGGILVLSETYYPGWRAFVDGSEVPVLRANYLFRGIELSAGEHQVHWTYDPVSFRLGLVLCGGTVLALVAGAAWGVRRRHGSRA